MIVVKTLVDNVNFEELCIFPSCMLSHVLCKCGMQLVVCIMNKDVSWFVGDTVHYK